MIVANLHVTASPQLYFIQGTILNATVFKRNTNETRKTTLATLCHAVVINNYKKIKKKNNYKNHTVIFKIKGMK